MTTTGRVVQGTAPLRVLIVDDESLIRWSLAETLADSGHTVQEAQDGKAALRQIADQEQPFDVVVLDYRLPDSNDFTLLAKIREQAPQAAVVMMTAFGTPEMAKQAVEIGAYRVVLKPFDLRDMTKLVNEAAASRGDQEEAR